MTLNKKYIAKNPSFIMDAKISLNVDGSVNLITLINYQEMLLQNDHVSRILFEKNPRLFNKLDNLLKIDSISLRRKEITSTRTKFNRLGTAVGQLPSVGHPTETVIYTTSVKGNIQTKGKYILEDGTEHVVDPNKIQKASDGHVGDTITLDDLQAAYLHSTVEEVDLFKKDRIASLAFRDFSIARQGGSDFKYGLEIIFSSRTVELISNIYKTLRQTADKVFSFYSLANMPGHYNHQTLSWNDDFFTSLNNASGFSVTMQDGKPKFAGRDAGMSDPLWVQAPSHYCAVMEVLGRSREKMSRKLFSYLNPMTSNPESILRAHKMFENLISELRIVYDLDNNASLNMSFLPSGTNSIDSRSGGGNAKTKQMVEYFFSDSVNIRQTKNFGTNFIGITKSERFPSLTSQKFQNRIEREKRKFFKSNPATNEEDFGNLSTQEKESLIDLESAYSYLTPLEVVVGRQKKRLSETTEQVFDNNFFNQLNLIKSSGHKKTKIDSGFNLSGEANLARATSLFGFTISPPVVSNVEKPIETEKDFIDVREFLGDNSYLAEVEDPLLKVSRPTLSKQEKQDSKDLMANFAGLKLLPRRSKKVSLKNFDLKDKESNFSPILGKRSSGRRLKNLPIPLKALLIDTEDNKTVRFNMVGGEFDPLKNIQTQESIKENFLNIKKIQYLAGFKRANGAIDMNRPIWRLMKSDLVNQNRDYLCRLEPFEDARLGIVRPVSDIPVLDSLFIIRGRQ